MSVAFANVSPKRTAVDGTVDGWYPYYAGFSLEFAANIVGQAQLPSDALIADPWVGSGTTTCAASAAGYASFGSDLNPCAIVIASAKLIGVDVAPRMTKLAHTITCGADRTPLDADDVLSEWLTEDVARQVRAIATAIQKHYSVQSSWDHIGSEPAFLLLALIRAVGTLANIGRRTNPTWQKPARASTNTPDVASHFARAVETLSAQASRTTGGEVQAKLRIADSRNLPLEAESVDLILSSPPYCTRIDYAVSTKFELAVLGHKKAAFDGLRRSLMGSPTIRAGRNDVAKSGWPKSLLQLLDEVRQHRSHRSAGYYHRNLLQYFADADASLREVRRILKPGGTAYLVLQSSYYKELFIDLPSLYLALADSAGLRGRVVHSTPVKRVLTTLNTRSRQYLDQRNYAETVICVG